MKSKFDIEFRVNKSPKAEDRYLSPGLIRLHILHHAVHEPPIFGLGMLDDVFAQVLSIVYAGGYAVNILEDVVFTETSPDVLINMSRYIFSVLTTIRSEDLVRCVSLRFP